MKTQPFMASPLSTKLTLPLLSDALTEACSVSVVPTATDDWGVEMVVVLSDRLGVNAGAAANCRNDAAPAGSSWYWSALDDSGTSK